MYGSRTVELHPVLLTLPLLLLLMAFKVCVRVRAC